MTRPLWESWSEFGRMAAAARIGIPVEGIVPTTNHLESFNAILKRKYVARYLRSGHRLRFDVLILLLITQILPQIYHRRRSQQEYRIWLASRFQASAGGQDLLVLQRKAEESHKEIARQIRSLCWWPLDEARNQSAYQLLQTQSLHTIQPAPDGLAYTALCNPSTPSVTPYQLSIHTSGVASCTCLDFYNNGKACKHIRALRIVLDSWIANGHLKMSFYYPPTLAIAQSISPLSQKPPLCPVSPQPPQMPSVEVSAVGFSATNWALVQALGKDDTVLGTAFDTESNSSDESESSNDSDSDHNYMTMGQPLTPVSLLALCTRK